MIGLLLYIKEFKYWELIFMLSRERLEEIVLTTSWLGFVRSYNFNTLNELSHYYQVDRLSFSFFRYTLLAELFDSVQPVGYSVT